MLLCSTVEVELRTVAPPETLPRALRMALLGLDKEPANWLSWTTAIRGQTYIGVCSWPLQKDTPDYLVPVIKINGYWRLVEPEDRYRLLAVMPALKWKLKHG